jgi:hypothetical protein
MTTNATPAAPDFSDLSAREIEDAARLRIRSLREEAEEATVEIIRAIRTGADPAELRLLRDRRRELREWIDDLGRLAADLLEERIR